MENAINLTQSVNLFHQIELFGGLSSAQLERIALLSACESYMTGAVIFLQASHPDAMYIVAEGQVAVIVDDIPTVYLGRGQVFGEMALVDNGVRSATIQVVDDGTLLYRIYINKFLALCQEDTAIGFLLMQNIAKDLSFKLRHRHLDSSDS
ncbi:MAG TPA: cyclic nucleotide-binding domain-containing protein [Aggregatilineales bacterium]|nr:cyclic nucleotide-binding domain-containing protein [Aggregatilineales bacterium]